MTGHEIIDRATGILHEAYGDDARFRDGQIEAIKSAFSGDRVLIVQKTGWGKSLVYFIATKMLRELGSGPTIIVSPLLSLMNNQIRSAQAIGLRIVTLNSENTGQWKAVYKTIDANRVDAVIVSPERLSDDDFLGHLMQIQDVRLLVVDEAHCISDWGNDFRPDYQRISKLLDFLPPNMSVIATTATANDRVVNDIDRQLDGNVHIFRGDLM